MDAIKAHELCSKLVKMTVERGCSKEEAANAKAQAEMLADKFKIDLDKVRERVALSEMSRRQRAMASGDDDLIDLVRRYHEQARREAQSKPICRHARRWVIKDIPTAFKCKECRYESDDWKAYYERKSEADYMRRKAKAKRPKASGCTNPFGVHGKGFDPERKWDSVSDFVRWHLMNTDWSFEEIAMQSRLKFSGKTSKNSVAWYVNKMKSEGKADYGKMDMQGRPRRRS